MTEKSATEVPTINPDIAKCIRRYAKLVHSLNIAKAGLVATMTEVPDTRIDAESLAQEIIDSTIRNVTPMASEVLVLRAQVDLMWGVIRDVWEDQFGIEEHDLWDQLFGIYFNTDPKHEAEVVLAVIEKRIERSERSEEDGQADTF